MKTIQGLAGLLLTVAVLTTGEAMATQLLDWITFENQTITDIGSAPRTLLTGNVGLVNDPISPGSCAGTAGYFNGSNSFIELQGSSDMNLLPLTISLWIKAQPQYGTDTGLVTKYGIASVNGFGLFAIGDDVRAWYFGSQGSVYSPTGAFASAPFLDGNWHHVVVVFDDSGGRLYVDGVLNASLPWAGRRSTCTTAIPVLLGEYRSEDLSQRRMNLAGLLGDVRILNVSLSSAQILAQYTAQIQGTYDTDGDGFPDMVEFANGSNPNDATSTPQLLLVNVDGQSAVAGQITRRGAATVSLETGYSNGTILYTLDGSEPSFGSTLYTVPFTLKESCTLQAVAYRSDFAQEVHTCPLSVVILPTLATTTAGGGSITIQPADGPYLSNSTAIVSASPSPGWTFLQWLGDASGTNPTASVQVTRNRTVQAVFGTTVGTAIIGNGSIWQAPMSGLYPYGSKIGFTGLPANGNYFALWGNAANSTNNPLDFTVTNPTPTLSAVFQTLGANQSALGLIADGRGKVTANPRANRYNNGATVQLTATPDASQSFIGWSGDASGTNNPLTVTMNQSKVITASFSKRPALSLPPYLAGLTPEGFRFFLTGEFGASYQVLGSVNLTNWLPLGVVTNPFGTVQFTDSAATNSAQSFYRALAQ